MPAHHFPVGSSMTTLHLCSDGTYLYCVWSPASLNEKTQKGHSVLMDVFHLSAGDVAGIGRERSGGTPPPPGQGPKGRVYFTYCSQQLGPILGDVAGGMWPLVHIQKKNSEIVPTSEAGHSDCCITGDLVDNLQKSYILPRHESVLT
ncbi:uncharacterized protein LOC143320791 [Chaetodon auriga]|uniref:uncharacterized protein LOC143320791 n=1 Tax=Chaetodon auriga TaxID=39042 RepID=UPI0040329ACB